MSSDEDFSLVLENRQPMETLEGQQPMETLEGIQKSISNYKLQYEHLLQEQKELSDSRDDQKDMAEKFRQRSQKLMESLEEDQHAHTKDLDFQKEKLHNLQREENELKSELKVSEAALDETEANNVRLKQQTDLSKADVPEKKVVFSGATGDATTSAQTFEMKAHIVYPMEGGTALITFEDEIVAQKILDMKNHKVGLGDECAITLEAKPIQLMMPRIVEMDTQVCPRRILVSNLPKKDCDILLDKLEIYFAKSRNGGGEVEDCDMLHDSGNVVITFVETNIAKYLADKHYHEVEFEKGKKQRVKVTPFLNGEITKLKNEQAVCARTVLLTGIPAIMEQDNLQDLLEIHFQQASNGGGEVDAFLYNPLGQRTLALFDDEDGLNV